MAVKKPLVLGSDGNPQQLQSGDSLSNTALLPQLTNGDGSSRVIGCPVYASAADTFKAGQANASGTKDIIGLVADTSIASATVGSVQDTGIITATTAQWDAVAGTTGGLTFNTKYFLDPANAGKITSTVPTTVGQYACQLGIAISTTELKIDIKQPILL